MFYIIGLWSSVSPLCFKLHRPIFLHTHTHIEQHPDQEAAKARPDAKPQKHTEV